MQAIILAGGKGTRLKPLTNVIPKSLVPIGDMPILEVICRQLKKRGFKDVVFAVNHLAKLYVALFENGEELGLNIKYSLENEPLGTAGPVSLIDNLDDNFLVMNGDILSTIDYADFFKYHMKSGNDVTIATYNKEVDIDLGVIEMRDQLFHNYIEKPTYKFDVSMGIYAFKKSVVSQIPRGGKLDLPELMLKLKRLGKTIGCYSRDYYWLDIGRADDYEKALEVFNYKRRDFLLE